MNKITKILLITGLVVSIGVITATSIILLRVRSDRNELQTTIDNIQFEQEQVIEPIDLVPIDEVDNTTFNKDNLLAKLDNADLPDNELNLVVQIFTKLIDDFDGNWDISYNQGYCDVFTLTFDANNVLRMYCYYNNLFVVTNDTIGKYWFATPDYMKDYDIANVEELHYLLQRYSDWQWSIPESVAILGYLNHNYKDIVYYERGLTADNNEVTFGMASMTIHSADPTVPGEVVDLYANIRTNGALTSDVVDTSDWLPLGLLSFEYLQEVLSLKYDFDDYELATKFESDYGTLNDYWCYQYDENNKSIKVSVVGLNEDYVDGYYTYTLFYLPATLKEAEDEEGQDEIEIEDQSIQ